MPPISASHAVKVVNVFLWKWKAQETSSKDCGFYLCLWIKKKKKSKQIQPPQKINHQTETRKNNEPSHQITEP